MAISKQQSMRPAEIELIDASNQHESTLQAHAQSLETLDKSLTAEITARDSADTALGTRIDNEAQARTSNDTTLQGQIDALVAVGAELNVIDSISVNGVAQTVTGKNVDITASSVVDGNAIAPSSVAATGNVSGSSVSDSVGSLADIRNSVHLVPPLSKVEFIQSRDELYGAISFVGSYGSFVVIFDQTGITIRDVIHASTVKHVNWS